MAEKKEASLAAGSEHGKLYLSLFSPERRLLTRVVVDYVRLPSSEGEIEILEGHASMVGLLETGVVRYRIAGEGEHLGIVSSGSFQVEHNHVKVLAETLELPGEIDTDRARRAQKKAEEMLNAASLEAGSFKKYQLKLERALIRQQAASGR